LTSCFAQAAVVSSHSASSGPVLCLTGQVGRILKLSSTHGFESQGAAVFIRCQPRRSSGRRATGVKQAVDVLEEIRIHNVQNPKRPVLTVLK